MNRAIDAVRTLLLSRRLLAAAWVLIVIQCAAAIWLFRPWAIGDSFHYLALAQGLSHGSYGTVTQAGFEPDVLRPPGYPLILALLLYVLHLPHVAVVMLQLVAYCGAIYSLQHYLRRAGGNPVPFIVVAAAYPFAMLYSTYLLTEAWVIVHADPGSLIYAGLRPGVARGEFAEAMRAGEVEPLLHRFAARPGDCILIPAGTVHAIGAGVVLAEIQQMSDATFRVFDIFKLPPARQLERLPYGWGILLDDLAAAVYANVVCQLLVRYLPFPL